MQNAPALLVRERSQLQTEPSLTNATRTMQNYSGLTLWIFSSEELPKSFGMRVSVGIGCLVGKLVVEEILAKSGERIDVLKMFHDCRMTNSKPNVGDPPLLIQPE